MKTITNKHTKKYLKTKTKSNKMKNLEEAFEHMEQVKKAADTIKNKKFFS